MYLNLEGGIPKRPDRIALNSASRLAELEDKERELIRQIKRYKDGFQRNENKDQVINIFFKEFWVCGYVFHYCD